VPDYLVLLKPAEAVEKAKQRYLGFPYYIVLLKLKTLACLYRHADPFNKFPYYIVLLKHKVLFEVSILHSASETKEGN